MSPPTRPIFLERHGYRQRRLIDAARLLPVLGVILLAVPMLWPQADVGAAGLGEGGAGDGLPTSRAIIYIFATWAALALVSALLVRALPAEAVDRLDGGGPPLSSAKAGRLDGGIGPEVGPGIEAEVGARLGAGADAASAVGDPVGGPTRGAIPSAANAEDGRHDADAGGTPATEEPDSRTGRADRPDVARRAPDDSFGGAG